MEQILLGALSLGLLWSVMTIGVYITFRILSIADMTVEGTITLGAAVTARVISLGASPWLGLALSILAGMLAGLITGLLHTKLGIPALLSGILTMIALFSINLRVMTKANISLLRMDTVYTPLMSLGLNKTWAVIALGAMCAALVIGLLYWFFGTEVGSAIRATGANPNMVRAQGIHTDTTLILGLMISNALVGISGSLIAQSQNYADLQMGTGMVVIGLASVIIGISLLRKVRFMKATTKVIAGSVIYKACLSVALALGLPTEYLKLLMAVLFVAALLSGNMLDKGRAKIRD